MNVDDLNTQREKRCDALDEWRFGCDVLLNLCGNGSLKKSLATVNLLTIGEGRRKLETSTITLCTTRVKKGMIKVK